MIRPITGELADQIFDILVQECDANDMGRDEFISWATSDSPGKEYRFGGMFGMAGKVWLERESANYPNGLRVSGPNHQELAEMSNPDELVAAVEAANSRLAKLEQ